MEPIEQGPAVHYEIELRQGEGVSAVWRPIRRVQPGEGLTTLRFDSLGAVKAYARHIAREEVRIVQVRQDGRRAVLHW